MCVSLSLLSVPESLPRKENSHESALDFRCSVSPSFYPRLFLSHRNVLFLNVFVQLWARLENKHCNFIFLYIFL